MEQAVETIATPIFTMDEERRAIAAVFAYSTPPVPNRWERTLVAGPSAIAYSMAGREPHNAVTVLASIKGAAVTIGYRGTGDMRAEDLRALGICQGFAEAEAAMFRRWLARWSEAAQQMGEPTP